MRKHSSFIKIKSPLVTSKQLTFYAKNNSTTKSISDRNNKIIVPDFPMTLKVIKRTTTLIRKDDCTTTKPTLVNINQLTFLVSIPYSTMNHISPLTSPNNQSIQPYPDPNCMINTSMLVSRKKGFRMC